MKEKSYDRLVTKSLRRRDVWTVEKCFGFLITERGGVSLVCSFSITLNTTHGVYVDCIGIAEVLVK